MPNQTRPTWSSQLSAWQSELKLLEKEAKGKSLSPARVDYLRMLIDHAKVRVGYFRKKVAQVEGAPAPKKRGGYRVCVRTVAGGWSTWDRKIMGLAKDLSGPMADKLMRKLTRDGYEVAKFQGRKRVK